MKKDIKEFWLWFEKNDELIRRIIEEGTDKNQKELANYIDTKILAIGHFSWEINAGERKKYEFVISPNREPELYEIAKKIINNAPEMEHWEFLPAKRANPVPDSFKLYDNNLDPVFIDPTHWKIIEEHGVVTVSDAEQLANLDAETLEHALDLVVTARFGEAFRINHISKIIYKAPDTV